MTFLKTNFNNWLKLIDFYLLDIKDIGNIIDIYLYGESAYIYYYKELESDIPDINSFDIIICIENYKYIKEYIDKLKENIIKHNDDEIFNLLENITKYIHNYERLNDKMIFEIIVEPLFYQISLYVKLDDKLYNIINFVFIINKYCNIVYNITTNDLIDIKIPDSITNIKILKIENIFDMLIFLIIKKKLLIIETKIMTEIDKLYQILNLLNTNYNGKKKELYNKLIDFINKNKETQTDLYNDIYCIYNENNENKDNIETNMIDYFYFYDDRNKDGDYQDTYQILTHNSYPSCLKYKTSEEIDKIIDDELAYIKKEIINNVQVYQFPRILYDLYNIYCYFFYRIELPNILLNDNTYEKFKNKSKEYDNDDKCKNLCAIINTEILNDVKKVLDTNKSILMNELYYYMLLNKIILKLKNISTSDSDYISNRIIKRNIQKIIIYKDLLKIILKYQLNINPIREKQFEKNDMLLYRATQTINEIPIDRKVPIKSYPISLSTSILNGILNDKDASTWWYRISDYNPIDIIFDFKEPSTELCTFKRLGHLGIIIVEKKHQNTESDIIFIPPLHPLLQIHVSKSEIWHPRLKISSPNQTGSFDSLQFIEVTEDTYDYLKTTKNIEQVSEEYRKKENIYFNKYMKYKHKYNNLKNIV
jgi:hypothetical protein